MKMLTMAEVMIKVGIGQATLYRWMRDGKMPRPIKFGRRTARWVESEIDDAINNHRSVPC